MRGVCWWKGIGGAQVFVLGISFGSDYRRFQNHEMSVVGWSDSTSASVRFTL